MTGWIVSQLVLVDDLENDIRLLDSLSDEYIATDSLDFMQYIGSDLGMYYVSRSYLSSSVGLAEEHSFGYVAVDNIDEYLGIGSEVKRNVEIGRASCRERV